jgi:hypothetical protein
VASVGHGRDRAIRSRNSCVSAALAHNTPLVTPLVLNAPIPIGTPIYERAICCHALPLIHMEVSGM